MYLYLIKNHTQYILPEALFVRLVKCTFIFMFISVIKQEINYLIKIFFFNFHNLTKSTIGKMYLIISIKQQKRFCGNDVIHKPS